MPEFSIQRAQPPGVVAGGGLGLFGLNLANFAAAREGQTIAGGVGKETESARNDVARPPVKSCILLFQPGGPSHHDTFDMKPGGQSISASFLAIQEDLQFAQSTKKEAEIVRP